MTAVPGVPVGPVGRVAGQPADLAGQRLVEQLTQRRPLRRGVRVRGRDPLDQRRVTVVEHLPGVPSRGPDQQLWRCVPHGTIIACGQCRRASTSISIRIAGSASPQTSIVAAGRTAPNAARSVGQQGSKSARSGSR